MKKGWLIAIAVVGLLVILAGALVVVLMGATQPLADAATSFCTRVAAGELDAAHASTASSFQRVVPRESFPEVVQRFQLGQFATASWSSRSIENRTGQVSGSFTTRDGRRLPLTVFLSLEGESWRVADLEGEPEERATAIGAALPPPVPGEDELRALVESTLLAFSDSVARRDFSILRRACSRSLQESFTAEQLLGVFRGFVEEQVDISAIRGMQASFAVPGEVNQEGRLVVEGQYEDPGLQVEFHLEFEGEAGHWRCSGLRPSVQVHPVVPEAPALRQLVEETLRSFHASVQARDFTAFHATTSRRMQEQFSPPQLASVFAAVLDGTLDASPLGGGTLALQEPQLDGRELQVTGQYEESGLQVQLRFVTEQGVWKLLGLGLVPARVVPGVPPPEQLEQLVETTLTSFGQSVLQKDFSSFLETCSTPLRQQVDAAQLLEVFKGLVEAEVDFTDLAGATPSYTTPPGLDEDQDLVLEGTYQLEGKRLEFLLKYHWEDDTWKVIGIRPHVTWNTSDEAASTPPVPEGEALDGLVQETLLRFHQGVQQKDFVAFYEAISPRWQTQTTPEALLEAFRGFVEKHADLSGVKGQPPEYTAPPLVDDNGLLRVEGRFREPPLHFNLGFLLDDAVWKLAAIQLEEE